MRTDKGEAFVMRRAGKSYREISKELGVAKSTLSTWFAGVDFSTAIKNELTKKVAKKSSQRFKDLNTVRGIELSVYYEQAEREAEKEMKLYRNLPLFTTAVGLYWGAGDMKSKHTIRISDSDPRTLIVFREFLERMLSIHLDKISLTLYLYPDASERSCKQYWTKHLGIKKFQNTQRLPKQPQSGAPTHGICTLVTTNTYAKKKLLRWIDQLPEMVLNTVPKKK